MNIVIIDKVSAIPNLKPFFSRSGRIMKKMSDGKTAQKIFEERSITFSTSFVSRYSHIIAKIDVNGREASMAAIGENFFPVSAIPTITKAVTIILIRYCI